MRSARISRIPEEWKTRALGELVSRVTERNLVKNSNVLTISAQHGLVNQQEFFNRRVASTDSSTYFLLRCGDFAYNKSYSEGYPAGVIRRLDRYESGIVSPLYICFRITSRDLDSRFFGHYFESGMLDDDLLGIAKEGVRNHGLLNVRVGDFFNLPIHLPPLVEQWRISDILDTLDTQIERSEILLDKLKRLSTGILADVFEGTRWREARLADLCAIASGSTPPRIEGSRYFAKDGVPWVKTLDLNEDVLRATDECVTTSAIKSLRLRTFPAGCVLVAMYGGWEQIGRTALLGVNATVNQAISALRPSSDILSAYLLRALQHHRSRWRHFAASTRKDPNITKKDVHEFVIPVPPLEEQQKIIDIYGSHLERIDLERAIRNRNLLLKQGLMKDLLTGRVRVSEAEAVLEDL